MIFLRNYKKLLSSDYTIYYNDKSIIVTKESLSNYLTDKEVIAFIEKEDIQKNEVLDILLNSCVLEEDLKDFLSRRGRDIIGERMTVISDENDYGRFAHDKNFAKYYGISNPVEITLKIIGKFDTQKDFDDSFDKEEYGRMVFGFWDIEKDEICVSFFFSHPVQTKMCFGDFGTSDLKKGSLFLKMEIED